MGCQRAGLATPRRCHPGPLARRAPNPVAGPLWPHVTLLVLLVCGSRWHWLPLGLLLGVSIIVRPACLPALWDAVLLLPALTVPWRFSRRSRAELLCSGQRRHLRSLRRAPLLSPCRQQALPTAAGPAPLLLTALLAPAPRRPACTPAACAWWCAWTAAAGWALRSSDTGPRCPASAQVGARQRCPNC